MYIIRATFVWIFYFQNGVINGKLKYIENMDDIHVAQIVFDISF